MGLMETAMSSMANTMEISSNCDIPVMTASGISVKTSAMCFAAGASAIGVGSAVNKCDSLISMIATVKGLVENTSKWTWNCESSNNHVDCHCEEMHA
jgi:imidazole glycerol phosphate synthase subunit HisF